ncbi:DUF4082 domain-containing protein [Thioclava indica]|uniref:Cadherin domain-containing protein n=1 Tax=Thioclava indica TaxID=1353528 RepID=A0A074JKX8_9RHOB|nr:DUF4082 domain-containing protein [Thioclava indica]KEO57099.1 hypothetical protein DT23_17160 [Thioclava indica]
MADNQIVIENQKQGTAREIWDAPASNQIEGFATDISVDTGDEISFKINVNAADGVDIPYHIEIYRLGYYGGDGATLVTTINGLVGTAQPDPITDDRGLVDAGNWSESASWLTPETAVSGVYLAKLVRDDNGETNQIPFILREDDLRADGSRSDIVLQTSDTTWQAYNGWGGNNGEIAGNFYGGYDDAAPPPEDAGPFGADRAFAVSYNRPFTTRDGGGYASGAQDYVFGADYAAIYWLEKNGYDISYISGVDTDRLGPSALLGHEAYISVGHDEYWSGDQRANVEAARDAGVNLLFWGGNDVYWKTRYEPSIDGNDTDYRTLITYKETWANYSLSAGPDDYANIDPSNEWTGTWRDMRFVDAVDAQGNPTAEGATPENALTGQLFVGDGGISDVGLDVPQELSGLRLWRDTSVEGVGADDISPAIIGYEWNTVPDDEYRPAGLILLSSTEVEWDEILVDQGSRTTPGTGTHSLSLYRAASGALVFGAGTVFWSWGLSNEHDSSPYGGELENTALKQFTVNLFADMGIQPGVSDLVLASQSLVRATPSTDTVAATATLTDLPEEIVALAPFVISGTATDDDGDPLTDDGQVAMVEVSFDNGATWRPASGYTNWTYEWTPAEVGSYQIVARAIDDSLNIPSSIGLANDVVTVTPAPLPDTFSLFNGAAITPNALNEGVSLELGMRFAPTQSGIITELHYFRTLTDSDDTDIRDGHLWDASGNLLATVNFTSAPGESGWQTATLSAPVTVIAGTTYTASYHTEDAYAATAGFFTQDFSDPYDQLTAPNGLNGVYAYSVTPVVPEGSYEATNYWVDVTYEIGVPDNAAPVFTSDSSFNMAENQTLAAILAADDPDDDPLSFSIAGGADAGSFSVGSSNGALSFLNAPDYEAPGDAGADNVYDLIVSVSDGINDPVEQAIQIAVSDVNPEVPPSAVYSLFDEGAVSANAINDSSTVELGVRFTPTQTGTINELRYFRSVGDSGDTDLRAGHLWDANGNLLATAQFDSAPGESGWQTAVLSSPILVSAGQTYTASYGTDDNYVGSQGYFASDITDASGNLTAPGVVNGVYAYGSTPSVPTASYNSTNYWVDVGFELGVPANDAPVISSPSAFSAAENQLSVGTVSATDGDGNLLSFAIAGGADAARFAIDAQSGALSFVSAPNFELPADAGGDNIYDVTVSVSDGIASPVTQAVQVSITDVEPETAPTFATLFEASDAPASTITSEATDYELGVKFTANAAGDVTDLRYYRGAADSGDTDIRTLNIWDDSGVNLGSVTVQSDPGESGWQVGALTTPVELTPGATYVASYGTTQNYVATNGYFNASHDGTDGLLSAPAGDNGVFAANTTGIFPTQSWASSNYWVDVGFTPDLPEDEFVFAAESAPADTGDFLF